MEKPDQYASTKTPWIIQKTILDKYFHFFKWSNTPESIIDVGIGDGNVAQNITIPHLPKNIKEYIGCDLSQNMLDFSKTIIDHPKYDTVKLDICAEDVPLEYQRRFDKVFACLLLHMVGSNVK